MYHLSMSATFMRVSPKGDKITIVGKTIKSKDQGMPASMKEFLEIGVFRICPKLLVPCHTEQGLNNKRDFALLAGARMKTGSLDIKQVRDLISSHFYHPRSGMINMSLTGRQWNDFGSTRYSVTDEKLVYFCY